MSEPFAANPAVLITGAGGAAVPALIEHLRAKRYRVVAVDADSAAPGLYLADAGYRIPFADDPQFAASLTRLCLAERIAVLVPLVDEELLPVARVAEELGIALLGPRAPFVAMCLDKHVLMQELAQANIAVPESRLLRDGWRGLPFPLVLKPRRGRGSRGLKIAPTAADLDAYLAAVNPDPDTTLVQRCVEGTEFTVSVVVWRDGVVRAVVPKEIIDKRGITRLAVTRRQPAIDRVCREIQDRFRADGPFNVQLRIDTRDGTPLPFEINPRFSTTITLTQAAGVDELGGLIDLAVGRGDVGIQTWEWREGVTMVRRTQDAFMQFEDFADRRQKVQGQ